MGKDKTMALQAREFAFKASNALKQSVSTKSHTIKETTNFPLSLISYLEPSLKHKFETTKAKTKYESSQYRNDMTPNTAKASALIIESEDQSIIDRVNAVSRKIHHHSTVNSIISYKFFAHSFIIHLDNSYFM